MPHINKITHSTLCLFAAVFIILTSQPVRAIPSTEITLEVDRFDDLFPAPSACTTDDNDCSLRGAIQYANSGDAGTDYLISLASGTYTLAGSSGENLNASGDLDVISRKVSLTGAGSDLTTIDAVNIDRVLDNRGGVLSLEHLKITKGTAPTGDYGGGGIINRGLSTLNLYDVRVEQNAVLGTGDLDSGGGITNLGTLTINNSTIINNQACDGGGIMSDHAVLTIVGSSVIQNQARIDSPCGRGGGIGTYNGALGFSLTNVMISDNIANEGGGLFYTGTTTYGKIVDTTIRDNITLNAAGLYNTGHLNLERVTLSGNQADGQGGGVLNRSRMTLVNITISGNTASYGGGFINGTGGITSMDHVTIADNIAAWDGCALKADSGSTLSIHNTILASSCPYPYGEDGRTCFPINMGGLMTDLDYNLSSDLSCSFYAHHDWTGAESGVLGLLQDNGGPTETMALMVDSLAIDKGDPGSTLYQDQRGAYRPADGDGNGSLLPDIGAFEYGSHLLDIFSWLPMIFKP
jgi:hypothetical protein